MKTAGRNKHQKAAHRPGERKVSRDQIEHLLVQTCSPDAEERLSATQLLCPCHIRGSFPAASEAIFRLLEDDDPRVRYAAWHTFEDGGIPKDEPTLAQLEALFARERDRKVRRFVEWFMGPTLRARRQQELQRLQLLARPSPSQRGKCDFCGTRDVLVRNDYDTMIPSGQWPRPALVCKRCDDEK